MHKRFSLLVAAALTVTTPALAHMPYVLPTVFDAGARERVTIEAAFTEDAFRPEVAMRDAPFEITDPDGRTTRLSGAAGALKARGVVLEIQPLADPASFAPGGVAGFTIRFDGRPLAGAAVTLFREAGYYDGRKQVEAKSDSAGRVTLTPADAGRYLLLVRYRPDAAPATGGPHFSYTTTLAFEVL